MICTDWATKGGPDNGGPICPTRRSMRLPRRCSGIPDVRRSRRGNAGGRCVLTALIYGLLPNAELGGWSIRFTHRGSGNPAARRSRRGKRRLSMARSYWLADTSVKLIRKTRLPMRFPRRGSGYLRNHVSDRSN